MAKTPDLCTTITLMPVEELGVDGAVLFADIMLPLEAMGVGLEIQPDLGPVIHAPIRDLAAVEPRRGVVVAVRSGFYVIERWRS